MLPKLNACVPVNSKIDKPSVSCRDILRKKKKIFKLFDLGGPQENNNSPSLLNWFIKSTLVKITLTTCRFFRFGRIEKVQRNQPEPSFLLFAFHPKFHGNQTLHSTKFMYYSLFFFLVIRFCILLKRKQICIL